MLEEHLVFSPNFLLYSLPSPPVFFCQTLKGLEAELTGKDSPSDCVYVCQHSDTNSGANTRSTCARLASCELADVGGANTMLAAFALSTRSAPMYRSWCRRVVYVVHHVIEQ